MNQQRWILLDRDGVINEESSEYIKSPEEFIFIPGSLEAIVKLTQAEFKIVIITNQAGIGRGLFSLESLMQIHAKLTRQIEQAGGSLTDIFFCPHHPNQDCLCRKPKPGLIHQFAQTYQIDLHKTTPFFVGDSLRDIIAAQVAHCVPILVKTGNGAKTLLDNSIETKKRLSSTLVFENLAKTVDHLLSEKNMNGEY